MHDSLTALTPIPYPKLGRGELASFPGFEKGILLARQNLS